MVFFVDDLFLRFLGFSVPPFDMIWVVETIMDFAEDTRFKEMKEKIMGLLRENRLLYELGETKKVEYERRNAEFTRSLKMANRANRMKASHNINLLG
jgi:ribosomal protein L17